MRISIPSVPFENSLVQQRVLPRQWSRTMERAGKVRIKSEEKGAIHLKRPTIFFKDRWRLNDAYVCRIETGKTWHGGDVKYFVHVPIIAAILISRGNDRRHDGAIQFIVPG
jgi:hypothetical protein